MTAGRRRPRVRRALALAAAPTFAGMALWSAVLGGSPSAMLCSALQGSPLDPMSVMYGLMAVFHAAPWLRLAAARRRRAVVP